MKKLPELFCIVLSLVLTSCIREVQVDFEIRSPKVNWSYISDKEIDFISNLNSEKLEWSSSVDGVLGSGPSLKKKLSAGNHKISLTYLPSGKVKTVDIIVKEAVAEEVKVHLLQESMNGKVMEINRNNIGVISINGSAKKFSVLSEIQNKNDRSACDLVLRDFVCKSDDLKKIVLTESVCNRQIEIQKHRSFKLINTINQMEAHDIDADIILESENFYVYVDQEVTDYDAILKCMKKIEDIVYPRVVSLWGECADIDANGKVTILFSPRINAEGVAVGFFNQKDFFTRNTDIKSDTYNPYSNEMDILYVCIPSEENANYNESSICATVGHELTHAINFSEKTYKKVMNGEESGVIEVFLDEGLSHLTESLIGLGETGGNQKFVNKYLSNTARHSFCDYDTYGNMDSIYQRGAMSLFLYYLFNKAGGFSWRDSGRQLNDEGGISFLRKIILSSDCGWKAIGDAFGVNTDELFYEFSKDILSKHMSEIFDFSNTDIITGEKIFECDDISASDIDDAYDIVKYSIIKFDSLNEGYIRIGWNDATLSGNIYFLNF